MTTETSPARQENSSSSTAAPGVGLAVRDSPQAAGSVTFRRPAERRISRIAKLSAGAAGLLPIVQGGGQRGALRSEVGRTRMPQIGTKRAFARNGAEGY